MKETLIKYGIITDLLSEELLNIFALYTKQVKSREFDTFYNFVENFKESLSKKQKDFDSLHTQIAMGINEVTVLFERVIPHENISLLSAFDNSRGVEFLKSAHPKMLVALAKISDKVKDCLAVCEEIISNTSDDPLTELTLRFITLNEHAPNTELCKLYKSLYESRESFSAYNTVKYAEEYSAIVLLFEATVKKLCIDTDEAYERIKNKNASFALYDRICRQYIADFHDVYLKLCELQGGNDVKI